MKHLSLGDLGLMTRKIEAALPPISNVVHPVLSACPSHLASNSRQSTADDIARLESALSVVSSDVPRGTGTIIGPDGAPVGDYWFGVVLAIRRAFGADGKSIAEKWSTRSNRYNSADFDKHWEAYDPHHPKPVTLGSVYMLAKAKGWHDGAPSATPPSPSTSRFRLLDRAAIMAIPPIQWRVKGLFPTTGIVAVYGPPSSGKSFLDVDLGVCIALGDEWFGHRTVACRVTYIILEGEAGLSNRIKAWEKHNGKSIANDFHGLIQVFSVSNIQDIEELGAILPRGGVVIIDTLNRAAPGMDENSSQDMGRILAGLKRLQEITGGLVLVVHHTGKDASKGMRGHSSLYAALDGAIEVEHTANNRSWRAAKVKDGPGGQAVGFKLHVINLGKDGDGDEITSCAVGPDTGAVFAPKEPSGDLQKITLKAIRRALSVSVVIGKAQSGLQTQCITLDEAVEAAAADLVGTPLNKRKNVARRTITSLASGGHLGAGTEGEEGWLWRKS